MHGDIELNCNVRSERDEAIDCNLGGWRVQIYREDDAPDCPFMAAIYSPYKTTDTVEKYILPDERCDTDAEQVGSVITAADHYIRAAERGMR